MPYGNPIQDEGGAIEGKKEMLRIGRDYPMGTQAEKGQSFTEGKSFLSVWGRNKAAMYSSM
jgi:hypothetical protein